MCYDPHSISGIIGTHGQISANSRSPRGSDPFVARYTSSGGIGTAFGDGDGYITTDLGSATASQDWLTGLTLMGDLQPLPQLLDRIGPARVRRQIRQLDA